MSRAHLPGLHIEEDGTVIVDSAASLARLLACRAADLTSELIRFEDREWRVANEWQRRTISSFLQSAYEEVCSTGRLPHPRTELPAIGTHVEVPDVGGKPSPDCRYGIGAVSGYEWWAPLELDDRRSFDGSWRVDVTYFEATGGWCGFPTFGQVLSPGLVYVIGDPTRQAWSSMRPDEIDGWLESRRQ